MGKKSSRTLAAAIAAGALIAIPATASAKGPSPADVTAYTAKADAALDRAVAMFNEGADRPALRQFRLSRAFLGKANMVSSRLALAAETDGARTRAANAWRLVAELRDANLAHLVALLEHVDASTDRIIAAALLADTKHRDLAIGIIQDLIDAGVTPKAETNLNQLISSLTSGRAEEIGQQMNALAEVKLPEAAQKAVAMAIQSNLDAQARVAAVLDSLIPQLPAGSRAQLEAALDLVHKQLAAAAELMDDVVDLMPPFVRPLIQRMLNDVKAMIEAITEPWIAPAAPATPATPPPPPSTRTPPPPPPSTQTPPPPPPNVMPNWIWDMFKQFWPVGTPPPAAPPNAPAPGMEGFFDAWFGPDGFMGGFFGPTGFMGGMFGGG